MINNGARWRGRPWARRRVNERILRCLHCALCPSDQMWLIGEKTQSVAANIVQAKGLLIGVKRFAQSVPRRAFAFINRVLIMTREFDCKIEREVVKEPLLL